MSKKKSKKQPKSEQKPPRPVLINTETGVPYTDDEAHVLAARFARELEQARTAVKYMRDVVLATEAIVLVHAGQAVLDKVREDVKAFLSSGKNDLRPTRDGVPVEEPSVAPEAAPQAVGEDVEEEETASDDYSETT